MHPIQPSAFTGLLSLAFDCIQPTHKTVGLSLFVWSPCLSDKVEQTSTILTGSLENQSPSTTSGEDTTGGVLQLIGNNIQENCMQ